MSVSLVVFTCEGREHLLAHTIKSFNRVTNYIYSTKIIAIDGKVNTDCFSLVQPDKVVQNYKRRGYIHSIINALNLVESDYLFWLEDDWEFTQSLDMDYLLNILKANDNLVQIRLSKTAPLTIEEKKEEIIPGIFNSIYGFSANPCLCRTALIKAGFQALLEAPKGSQLGFDGFENFLSRWYESNNYICAVLDPGSEPDVIHAGYLESTPRQWHMTSSLEDDAIKDHLYSMGEPPALWRRIYMLMKFIKVSAILSIQLLFNYSAYEFVFRIVTTNKKVTK